MNEYERRMIEVLVKEYGFTEKDASIKVKSKAFTDEEERELLSEWYLLDKEA